VVIQGRVVGIPLTVSSSLVLMLISMNIKKTVKMGQRCLSSWLIICIWRWQMPIISPI